MGLTGFMSISMFYEYWCYVTLFFGAYIAETYWARFCVVVVISSIGHIILIVTGLPGGQRSPRGMAHQGNLSPLIVALVFRGIGSGLFPANILPLVAEQYRPTKLFVEPMATREKIVDVALTINRVNTYVGFWLV
ncbi:hypothetical protein DFH08DRAFT_821897 [Mycena albidolilacea]|uniref:Uncharacterized protein n=1 Tax=Mycena albidolilacea TaxID=1033008 RepID=A0AAD6Z9W7_9AGAR|nr:hypothetical protein DFH08DRAFT_821897 [Mycena albidolilacea]